MIVNTAKQRMLEGQPALGAGVGLGSPTSAALLAQAGFTSIQTVIRDVMGRVALRRSLL